jgi:hypothetical protein
VTLTLYSVPADITGTITAGGPPVTVTMGTPGQNARVTFTGTTGQRVSLGMSNVTIGSSSFFGTKVSILRPDGTTLVAPVNVGTSGGAIDTQNLPADGTYTILVDPQDANTGSMTLALHDVPSDATATIVPGGPPVTVTMGTPGQNARVTFSATAGQRVSLDIGGVTVGTSTCCSVRVSILDPADATVVFPLTVGTNGGFIDSTVLTSTGTYTIFVDPQGSDTGNVTLTLYDVPADGAVSATPGGGAATVTTTTPGQNGRITFAGTAGQRISARITPICCISRISVLNPDGTVLVPATSFGTGGGFIDTFTLPTSGTHELFIDPFGDAVGSVTATVYNVPPDVTGTATFGPTTTVTTTVPGQNASVTFTGTGGDGVRMTLGPFNCCSTIVTVLAPDGSTIAGPGAFNPDGGPLFMRLPTSGTYTIFIDPQGPNTGSVHLKLEVDNTAPAPPVLTLNESSNDSHIIGATFYYRPTGAGGTFTVGATSSDAGGLSKVTFPGLAGGFSPTGATDDFASPFSQVYTWTTGATFSNPSNTVLAVDRVGNTSSTPFGVVRDPDPPVTSDNTAAIGFSWKNTNVVVNFSADDGSGAGPARTHFTTDGSTPTDTSPIGAAVTLTADGIYTVKYFSVDNVSNVETVRTAGTQIRIDKTPPSSATLDPLPTVIKNGQVLTGSGSDALSGVASITYLYCSGGSCTPSTPIGTSTTGPTYPFTWSSMPGDGTYQLVARVTDAAGNTLDSAKRTVTIDNTAPNTTITAGPTNPTNQTTASFSFTSTEAGSTFECRLDSGAWSSCTTPRSYSGLTEGSHTFDVRATDPVGNTDQTPATRTWTVDLTAPETTITANPTNPSSGSVSFSFTSSEGGSTFQCRIDGAAFASCTSPKPYTGLTTGSHTFEVRATDAAGNTDATAASFTWTVDATPPDTTITSFPVNPSNQTTASFGFTSTEAGTFQCKLDTGAFVACTSPHSYTGLSDGSHTVQVRAIDGVGNVDATPATYTWTVDTGAPNTTITASPVNPTNQTTASFSFTATEGGSTFQCRLDGAAFAGCTSSHSYTGLSEGSHTFEVRAIDSAGNIDPSPASFTWVVDTTAPETAITAAPANPTNATSATFGFTSSEGSSTFQCRLDGAAFAACTTPRTYTGLAEGSHTFEVRATDPAGNTDATPASFTWTVDTTAPQTTIDSGPASPTNATSASFTFSSSEAGSTFQCRLDGGAFAACTSGQSYTGLADGSHTFEVRATDPAGTTDATPATHSWAVDTGAPNTTITTSPNNPTNSTSASFSFTATEAGSTFECKLDTGSFASCTSGQSYTGLAEGSHTFEVRATDPAGNTDGSAASFTWTVDTTAPQTTITVSPSDPSSPNVSFSFTSSETGSTFECRIDGAAFAGCTSPKDYTSLAGGSHTFEVRATDAAGNTDASAASFTWTVDATAPDTTVDTGPTSPTNSTSATFTFSSNEAGSSFQCKLDAGAFASCTSGQSYTGLTEGSHTFQVRATDALGNTDPTPASFTWTVDTTPPQTSITASPGNPTGATSAAFEFTSSEPSSSFECKLDTGSFAPCTSPKSYAGLGDGSHTFEVRATDQAGNTDASPATYTWTVDTAGPETTVNSGPADPTNQTSASFTFSADEPGSTFECRLDTGAFASCTTPASYSGLSAGSHTFHVRATDSLGNTDPTPATWTWTIDLTAPETTVDTGPDDPTNQSAAEFTFSSSEPGSGFECKLDGGAFTACSSPQSYSGLAPGSHTFAVRATDPAGNTDGTPATYAWVVDVAAPETSISSGPSGATNATNATFEFTANEAGSTFECKLDTGVFASCTSPVTYTSLAEGVHVFEVRATDPAGNTDTSPASRTWTVDVTAPAAPAITSPADGSANNTGTIALSGTAEALATVEVFDGAASKGTASANSGGAWSKALTGVADGSHTYTATARDPAGNVSLASNAVTVSVDTTAPNTTITTGPLGATASTAASFTFTADDPAATFECSLDGAAYTACTSPKTYTGLGETSHTFSVRATDAAGNTDPTPATRTWTVDVTAPAAPVITSPADGSVNTTGNVTVSGTAPTDALVVELFEGATSRGTTSVSGGTWSRALTGVADGSHTYTAVARDAAGNTSGSSNAVTVTVDTTAPETTIDSGPTDPTTETTAQFFFSASQTGSTFECKLDTGAFAPCTSPQTYSGLAAGPHTFEVRATDPAGNVDGTPATYAWTVT